MCENTYTGLFIIYSGIIKIYYRENVGHVFTKPVQIEGATQNFFPSKFFSSQFTFLPLGDASVYSEKMAAPGDKLFYVSEYHTSKSVVTVQRAFRAKYPCCRLKSATRIPPQPSHTETPTHVEIRTRNQCGDTTEKSQAPDDGCINIRNMLSIEEVK